MNVSGSVVLVEILTFWSSLKISFVHWIDSYKLDTLPLCWLADCLHIEALQRRPRSVTIVLEHFVRSAVQVIFTYDLISHFITPKSSLSGDW